MKTKHRIINLHWEELTHSLECRAQDLAAAPGSLADGRNGDCSGNPAGDREGERNRLPQEILAYDLCKR